MTFPELEEARLRELVAEMEAKGYRVIVRPADAALPAALKGMQPDLLAVAPGDNVVFEIRSGSELRSPEIVRLARAVESIPNWRFELVAVNPQSAPDVPLEGELASPEQIDRFLTSARALIEQGQLEAAALLAWSALEAVLRRWATEEDLDLQREGTSKLLKQLYSLGRLDPPIYSKLLRLMEFRNSVAHGYSAQADRKIVSEFVEEVGRLQRAA